METKDIGIVALVLVFGAVIGFAIQMTEVSKLNANLDKLTVENDGIADKFADVTKQVDVLQTTTNQLSKAIQDKDSLISQKDAELTNKATEITQLKTANEINTVRIDELTKQLEPVEPVVETATEVNGVVFDKIELNYNYATPYKVDYYDLDKLYNGEIKFDGDTYYARETFTADVVAKTSLLDNDFDNVYLTNGINSFTYTYEFDSPVDLTNLCDENKDNNCNVMPLTINFLGKQMEIVKVDSEKITARSGEMKYVKLGESIVFDGKTLKLDTLLNNGVLVNVDGEIKEIKVGSTKTVGNLDVFVNSIGVVSSFEGAVLVIGSDVYREYEQNSNVFGDNYEFSFDGDNTSLKSMTLKYTPEMVSFDDEFKPLKSGESLNFLGYITLTYNGLKEIKSSPYELEFKKYNSTINKTVKIKTNKESIKIKNDRVTEFYFDGTVVYYKDINKVYKQGIITDVTFENGDTKTAVDYDGGNLTFTIQTNKETIETIKANITGFESLGIKDDAENTDVIYVSGTVEYKIGAEDNSVTTNYGVVIETPDKNSENDKLVFNIPDKQVFAEFSIV